MPPHPSKGRTAIAGLGLTPMGKVWDTPVGFAVEAIRLALEDAGLRREDLDGICVNPGIAWAEPIMSSFQIQQAMGLRDLRWSAAMNSGGASAATMIQTAALAVDAGLATTIACVFSDAPLKPPPPKDAKDGAKGGGSGAAYGFARGLDAAYGHFGVNALYALVARRYMDRYGVTNDDLGRVAVAERAWANGNPHAQLRDVPLTLDDYHRSRWIVEPFRLLDCCLVSNGGAAVIVTSAERARDLRRPPVYLWGFGQGHPGGDPLDTLSSGAGLSSRTAYERAGISAADVDVLELYDCYTLTVLVTLEDYGFCPKGEAARFLADGRNAPGGRLPINTGGGQLSSFYMWGMTPVSEGVIQARGDGGERQVADHDVVLVSGNGGVLATHSTLVLSPLPS
jgi:acetyl-CoA acetyltransferase